MTIFSQNFKNLVTATLLAEDQQIKTETDNISNKTEIMDTDESAKSQDFFQDNYTIKVKYTTKTIK